jgi:hypothetical protein
MSKLRFIKLYEEYTDLEQKSLEKHHSWQEVRDVIQTKLPFIIIDFESEDSLEKCIKEELFDEEYVKQTYHLKRDGETIKYPSVFIFESDPTIKDRVLNLVKRFDIFRIITADLGENLPQLYQGGETVDLNPNPFSSLELNDMQGDDYYKINDMYYKFV